MADSYMGIMIKNLYEATEEQLTDDTDIIVEDMSPKTRRAKLSTLINKIKTKLSIGTASALNTNSKEIVGAINELNTNIGGGAALGPKMKSGTASYRIIGKMCFVTVETTPSSALVQGDVIISGIPAPLEEFYLSLGAASGNYSAYMKMAGTVIAYYPGYAKTERIDACFCYPVG